MATPQHSNRTATSRSKRTAVLAVHGMGIQRPMETVRGIVNAVWLEEDNRQTPNRQFWTNPEPNANDIDLPVIVTNALPNSDRTFDFHEFYWSHLMTGTRAVAVLLWLFELVGKGPLLKPGMRSLWSSSAIFLEFVILSSVYLVVLTIERLAHVEKEPWLMVLEPFLFLAIRGDYTLGGAMDPNSFPWSLDNAWSQVAAFLFIGVYLALNKFFLASFFGDAARYFRNSPDNVAVRREIRRQAVKTLEMLHSGDKYDRIIIVAHSLGTVVAYDMLRAYFGRICKQNSLRSAMVWHG